MSRPRHVSILIANLPAERDRRVIRECLTLEAAGYEVTVIAPRGVKGLKVLPGSRNVRLKPYPIVVLGSGVVTFALEFLWSFLCVSVRLAGELLRGRAHAVQACNPPDVYWPLALVWRALGRPWVFDHHDLCPEIFATRSGGESKSLAYRTLVTFEWLTLRTASAVVATNQSFYDNAIKRGVRADKLTIVRNGPARTEIAPVDDIEEEPAGTPADPFRLVYLGVLGPQDNVAGAVLAAEELARLRGREDWHLTIAGDGESMPALRQLVAERGLDDLVTFAGWLEATDVDALLRNASVAIQPDLPTRMNDLSTMAKTVEYLARGIPVVAVDMTETRRTAEDAALYVPTGSPEEIADAIDRLLENDMLREKMRALALARFTDVLSWEHQAAAYTRMWNRLFAKRSRDAAPALPLQREAEQSSAESVS
jgi:glycosyltransferase involved in cell wall biosynthesis